MITPEEANRRWIEELKMYDNRDHSLPVHDLSHYKNTHVLDIKKQRLDEYIKHRNGIGEEADVMVGKSLRTGMTDIR